MDTLPDATVATLAGFLEPRDVASVATTAKALRAQIAGDATWRSVTEASLSPSHEYVTRLHDECASVWSYRRVVQHWSGVEGGWKGRTPLTAKRFGIGSGPLFCVHSMCDGRGTFVTAGGDGWVRIVQPGFEWIAPTGSATDVSASSSSAAVDAAAAPAPASGGGAAAAGAASAAAAAAGWGWSGDGSEAGAAATTGDGADAGGGRATHDADGDFAMSGGAVASSASSVAAIDAAAAEAAAAGSRIAAAEASFQAHLVGSKMRRTLAKRHEWHASDAGMLGCSYDSTTNTIMTGSFDGQVKHWQLNTHELEGLDHLPVKRLKAILSDRKVPFDDLREKSEFVARIRTYNALPPARQSPGKFSGHAASVISISHVGDIAVTGGNDTAAIYDVKKGTRLHTLGGHLTGVDAVHYDPRTGVAYSGGKDGDVRAWSVETCKLLRAWSTGATWIWCIKSGTTWQNSAGWEAVGSLPSDPAADTAAAGAAAAPTSGASRRMEAASRTIGHASGSWEGDGNTLLAGDTAGYVRLFDLRSPTCQKRLRLTHSDKPGPRSTSGGYESAADAAAAAGGGIMQLPIAGLAVMGAQNRFVTTSFDGRCRIFDLRTFGLLSIASSAGGERLTRVDVHHDLIAAGSMNGSLEIFDMDPKRGEITAARTLHSTAVA